MLTDEYWPRVAVEGGPTTRCCDDHLVPAPVADRGARPAGVRYWVNLADTGDLVAIPRRLGDRFPVDQHADTPIGRIDFHTLGAYLSSPLTAAAITPFVLNSTPPDQIA